MFFISTARAWREIWTGCWKSRKFRRSNGGKVWAWTCRSCSGYRFSKISARRENPLWWTCNRRSWRALSAPCRRREFFCASRRRRISNLTSFAALSGGEGLRGDFLCTIGTNSRMTKSEHWIADVCRQRLAKEPKLNYSEYMKDILNLRYVLFLAVTVALGGLLFGFDIAIITGAGQFLAEHFHLNDLSLGLTYSSLLFGCVVGSAFAGYIADRFGRKAPLLWVAALFALTSAATGLAPTFNCFLLARFIGGLSVGGISILAPMYIAEIAPPKLRGRLWACYQLAIVVGILASFLINYLLRDSGEWNWRWMFMTGILPSAVFFGLLFGTPETPRYLLKIGKEKESFDILLRIFGPTEAKRELNEIQASLTAKGTGWRELTKGGMPRALLVGFGLAVLVHFSGINTIIDYAPLIFKSAGFKMEIG